MGNSRADYMREYRKKNKETVNNSSNKKYYWLKLKDNFFETDEMIVLESMTDGYIYSNILLKLYLRSIKNNGKLMLNDCIPYNSDMLANITRHSVGDIEKAIKIFEKLKLIEILDNGAIYMLNIQNFIGKGSSEADRKKAYRDRIKNEKQMLLDNGGTNGGTISGHLSHECLDKRPLEIDIDIEKDIDIDDDRQNTTSSSSCQEENFLKFFLDNINPTASSLILEKLKSWGEDVEPKLIKKAIELALENNVRRYAYINAILNNWLKENVTTYEVWEARERIRAEDKAFKEQNVAITVKPLELPEVSEEERERVINDF